MKTIKLIILTILLNSVIFTNGCLFFENPLYEPSKNIVKTIFPEYKKYVKKDDSLSDIEKKIRTRNAEAFEILIEKYGNK